ncbi:hypothetical protein PCE1_002989 [Barthelona sp. PCE]
MVKDKNVRSDLEALPYFQWINTLQKYKFNPGNHSVSSVYSPGFPISMFRPPSETIFQIYIPSHHLTIQNPNVMARQVWGNNQTGYHENSDLVASLYHTGKLFIESTAPGYAGAMVLLTSMRIKEGTHWGSTCSNRLTSRKASPQLGVHGYRILEVLIHTFNGHFISPGVNTVFYSMHGMFNLTNEFALAPHLVLQGSPFLSLEERFLTSILFFDTLEKRYELVCNFCRGGMFRLAQCELLMRDEMPKEPLPSENIIEVLFEDFDFDAVSISHDSITVGDITIQMRSCFWNDSGYFVDMEPQEEVETMVEIKEE